MTTTTRQPRPRGRPRVEREEELAIIQTRAPATLRNYLAANARGSYGSLQELYKIILENFLEEKPYIVGSETRFLKASPDTKGEYWVQVNILIPQSLKDRIVQEASRYSVPGDVISASTFCYTALVYFTQYQSR